MKFKKDHVLFQARRKSKFSCCDFDKVDRIYATEFLKQNVFVPALYVTKKLVDEWDWDIIYEYANNRFTPISSWSYNIISKGGCFMVGYNEPSDTGVCAVIENHEGEIFMSQFGAYERNPDVTGGLIIRSRHLGWSINSEQDRQKKVEELIYKSIFYGMHLDQGQYKTTIINKGKFARVDGEMVRNLTDDSLLVCHTR